MDLTDKSDISTKLVKAVMAALAPLDLDEADHLEASRRAVSVTLRLLADEMDDSDSEDWPDSGDLELIANDIDGDDL